MQKILIIIICLLLVFTACTKQKPVDADKPGTGWAVDDAKDRILPGIDPLKVRGNIIVAGSSTVYPLTEKLAERFRNEGYPGNITIDSIGSGAGFERFCTAGEIDIVNASRPIKNTETASARKIGREPLEFRVGTDALAVAVNRANTFLTNLTRAELAVVFSGSRLWSDINPAWPAREIQRFIPGTDSGTFDYFVEAVLQNDKRPLLEAANLQLSEDDNILVQGIEGSPFAIGFFGYAYYAENREKLNVLAIDGIKPAADTVDNGSYPLARPLFIYSSANIMKEKPQVAAFIAYYLAFVNEEITAIGYFPADARALDIAKQTWLDAAKGLY